MCVCVCLGGGGGSVSDTDIYSAPSETSVSAVSLFFPVTHTHFSIHTFSPCLQLRTDGAQFIKSPLNSISSCLVGPSA